MRRLCKTALVISPKKGVATPNSKSATTAHQFVGRLCQTATSSGDDKKAVLID